MKPKKTRKKDDLLTEIQQMAIALGITGASINDVQSQIYDALTTCFGNNEIQSLNEISGCTILL